MIKKLVILLSLITFLLEAGLVFAKDPVKSGHYRVDLIIFTHDLDDQSSASSSRIYRAPKGIVLNPGNANYQLLPSSQSVLKDDFWRLSHNANYQVLGYYSWYQPNSSDTVVIFPEVEKNGLKLNGNLKIIKNNFYNLTAKFAFDDAQGEFSFPVSGRLKEKTTYYFDHPHAGLLIVITS